MKIKSQSTEIARPHSLLAAFLGLFLAPALLLSAESRPLLPWEFSPVSLPGLGDRQNSGAWSMQWWKGRLYVGTVRSWYCWVQAWSAKTFPFIAYPPTDPAFECAPDPRDLPLQAEIWRYTPETNTWDMLYRSPLVPIPGSPDKVTANELGYRTMTVFVEPDGTEALYVGGATPNLLFPPMPPPRILRSTDGTTFEAVPHDPGTLLGNLGQDQATFRDMEVYKGRLYVINGKIQGDGSLLEAENPAGGNDSFRWVTPDDVRVFELAPYNGFLYVGVADSERGYAVMKTRAIGRPPYRFIPVVTNGAYLRPRPSNTVVSMFVFKSKLYVGTNRPAELIRINPDDTWDLVLGEPRFTPEGMKRPISGLGSGFDWPLNNHIWRMEEHEGVLYVGTADDATTFRRVRLLAPFINARAGFDFFTTKDGHFFTPITVTGFDDIFQHGARTFASTPLGLFLGAVNLANGARIYLGAPTSGNSALGPPPPQQVEVETLYGSPFLTWEPPLGAVRYHVFRSDLASEFRFMEIGDSDEPFFWDGSVGRFGSHNYYVVAEGAEGAFSGPSNMLRSPSGASPVTFRGVTRTLTDWRVRNGLIRDLHRSRRLVEAGQFDRAIQILKLLQQAVKADRSADPWRAGDSAILLGKLSRRVILAQWGVIPVRDVLSDVRDPRG